MEFFQKTDIGLKRENNEDAIGVFYNQTEEALAVIADGMGGHLGGDVASKIALTKIGTHFKKTSDLKADEFINWIDEELIRVNDFIMEKSQNNPKLYRMGTTFVGAFLSSDQKIVYANLGDTRGYLFKDGNLKQITIDQTLVNELLNNGELSPQEAANFPNKNIITSTLGVDKKVDPIYRTVNLTGKEMILLNSDGLSDMVSDEFIANKLASSENPQNKVDELVQEAKKNGGIDNISLILGTNLKRSDQA